MAVERFPLHRGFGGTPKARAFCKYQCEGFANCMDPRAWIARKPLSGKGRAPSSGWHVS